MVCKNCGNILEENTVFCDKCGKRVVTEETDVSTDELAEKTVEESVKIEEENPEEFIEIDEEATDSVEISVEEVKPVKNKKKKWIILTAAVVIVALLAGVVALAFPYINDAFWRTVLSEEDYFKHVVKNNASEYADSVLNNYTDMLKMYENGEVIRSDVKAEFGEKSRDIMGIDWLQTVAFSGEGGYVDSSVYASGDVKLNGVDITAFNVAVDEDGTYLDFPETSNGALHIKSDAADASSTAVIAQLYKVAPDEKVLQELIVRYVMYMADCVEDVEEKSEVVRAGDVSKKYLKMTAKIDEKVARKAVETVLREAKTDEDIKKIILELGNAGIVEDADTLYKEFQNNIDESLKNINIDEDFKGEFIIWVDSKGSIAGMGVNLQGAKAYFVNVLNGRSLGTVFNIETSEYTALFEGSGKMKSNKFNGDYVLKVMDVEVLKVGVKNVDYSLIKKDIFNGQVEIEATEEAEMFLGLLDNEVGEILSDAKISIDFKTTKKYEEKVQVSVESGKDMLLSVNYNSKKVKGKLPEFESCTESDDYISIGLWLNNLYNNINHNLEKAGISLFQLF